MLLTLEVFLKTYREEIQDDLHLLHWLCPHFLSPMICQKAIVENNKATRAGILLEIKL